MTAQCDIALRQFTCLCLHRLNFQPKFAYFCPTLGLLFTEFHRRTVVIQMLMVKVDVCPSNNITRSCCQTA